MRQSPETARRPFTPDDASESTWRSEVRDSLTRLGTRGEDVEEHQSRLHRDAGVLGLEGRTEIVKAALDLLPRRAAEERMARSLADFYGKVSPPRPVGLAARVPPSPPMSLPEPCRGEVWDVDFPDFGKHSSVVLSVNSLYTRLGHVAVILVTGTRGPEETRLTSPSPQMPASPDTTSPTQTSPRCSPSSGACSFADEDCSPERRSTASGFRSRPTSACDEGTE